MNGIRALVGRERRVPQVRTQEDGNSQSRNQSSLDGESAQTTVLDFSTSRIVRNSFLLFKSPSIWYFITIPYHRNQQLLFTACYHPWKGFQLFSFLPIGQHQKETLSSRKGKGRAKNSLMRLINPYAFSSALYSSRLLLCPDTPTMDITLAV